ncbi:CidA/LrgA family protein [Nocardioides sp. R-C-SC26]|uniref:CidA/LrgA family protein n=1 Tax=Nocardioides sp. R-C-SC26 TaxID=2870414 RepID=UPI001E2C5863|nr:CidA/LrgA family protein [Nocardioides sp. R-C-SC26]
MITGLVWLVTCQAVGEVLVRLLDVDVPGPVVGMILLLVVLRWHRADDDHPAVLAGSRLLEHLQLLFIPAGVGIVAYGALLRADAVPIAVSLLVSWLVGIVAVAAIFGGLRRRHGRRLARRPA